MYLTQTNAIRGLTKKQYQTLKELCKHSNSLYNVALYNIRQHYFENKEYLTYENNYHKSKENENYKMLQAGIAQQTLKAADRSFKSFFKLIKKAKNKEYQFKDIKLPHYRQKGAAFNLTLSTNAINIKNGYLTIPMSRTFKKLHDDGNIKIPFPKNLESKSVKEVRILPMNDGKYFKIQYVYEIAGQAADVDKNNIMAIDLGVNNLASCITTLGTSFVLDGRKLKSINQGWNKEMARLQSIADKQGNKRTNRMFRITEKRNNRTKDIMRKSARYIVDYCIENRIGTVIVGYNPDFKRNVNLGKHNNQTFTSIAFSDFRQLLACLCGRYGIDYVEQEESYTSKASFLDRDELPVYDAELPFDGRFSGKRVRRGLYRASDGKLVNADVNAAANILRKCRQDFDFGRLCSGLLASPCRIRLVV